MGVSFPLQTPQARYVASRVGISELETIHTRLVAAPHGRALLGDHDLELLSRGQSALSSGSRYWTSIIVPAISLFAAQSSVRFISRVPGKSGLVTPPSSFAAREE